MDHKDFEKLNGSKVVISYNDEKSFSEEECHKNNEDEYSDLNSSSDEISEVLENENQDVSSMQKMMKDINKFIILRSKLEELEEEQAGKVFMVATTREELLSSKTRLEVFYSELQNNMKELEISKENKNTARTSLLRAQEIRIRKEIVQEKKIQESIDADLKIAELEALRSDLKHEKMIKLSEQVREKEEQILVEKDKLTTERDRKLQKQIQQRADMVLNQQKRKLREIEEYNNNLMMSIKKAELAYKKNIPFIKATALKVKTKREDQKTHEEQLKLNKMNELIKLKTKIDEARENIKALKARKDVIESKRKIAELDEVNKIVEETDGNKLLLLARNKMDQDLEQKVKKFEKEQKKAKVKIVEKLLNEQRSYQKRRKVQPYLFDDTRHDYLPPKYQSKINVENVDFNENGVPVLTKRSLIKLKPKSSLSSTKLTVNGEPLKQQDKLQSIVSNTDEIDIESQMDSSSNIISSKESIDDDVIVRPEFEGNWEITWNKSTTESSQESIESSQCNDFSKKEKSRKVISVDKNVLKKSQVASCKYFPKGKPLFASKPTICSFADIEIGQVYTKQIEITNISYSITYIKFLDISEHLKDFTSIEFKPPGAMSAGTSCSLTITFKPMINRNLEGAVMFKSENGIFKIPIKCSIKKCDVRIDPPRIDFCKETVGEKSRAKIVLSNKGVLSTEYVLYKYPMNSSIIPLFSGSEVETAPKNNTKGDHGKPSIASTDKNSSNEELIDKVDSETCNSENLDTSTDEAVKSSDIFSDEINLEGCVPFHKGVLHHNTTSTVHFEFTPTVAGIYHKAKFILHFEDKNTNDITIEATGYSNDVPVWVERKEIDMRICTYDRLYQDKIVINNRANTALKLVLQVPKYMKNHMEVLPKNGYIQAKSTFTAQLKFLPRKSLQHDAPKYFDHSLGVLQVPMKIQVSQQRLTVDYVVNAVLTSSELCISEKVLQFGTCCVCENVFKHLEIKNTSILPQMFGFVDLPEFIEVQPNDGFGKILPKETLKLDVIFKAQKACNYDVTVSLKNEFGQKWDLRVLATGVLPPLTLSHQVVKFAATALYDKRSEKIEIMNTHLDANEFNHSVPRIGMGEIFPVGPTSFSFIVPKDAPFHLYPQVGTVYPGQRCLVSIEFAPKLLEKDIRDEIRKIRESKLAKKLEKLQSRTGSEDDDTVTESSSTEILTDYTILDKNSDEYVNATTSLIQSYHGNMRTYSISCHIASGECTLKSEQKISYNAANTIFLQVVCPTVRPPVVVLSNGGRDKVDFGQVSTGLKSINIITLLNISQHNLQLKTSLLNHSGPFNIVNAFKQISPGETHAIKASFCPDKHDKYQEKLQIYSKNAKLELTLAGEGVFPSLKLDPDVQHFEFSNPVAKGDKAVQNFNLINQSSLSIDYEIIMKSAEEGFRTNGNVNGTAIFDCVPASGSILPGSCVQIAVTFQPDHANNQLVDKMKIILFENMVGHEIELSGKCSNHMMYLENGDLINSCKQTFLTKQFLEENQAHTEQVLLTFTSKVVNNELMSDTRSLKVYCLKSPKFPGKKGIDFLVENYLDAQSKGFQFEVLKSNIELGGFKNLNISWFPNNSENSEKNLDPVHCSFHLIVRGDIIKRYDVTLVGMFKI